MTDKQQFWIADAEGAKAVVAGAEARDEWVHVRGWTEATEPVDGEFQYIRNVDHGGVGRMTHAAVALHKGLGWVPTRLRRARGSGAQEFPRPEVRQQRREEGVAGG
jgi:hypothetical protein